MTDPITPAQPLPKPHPGTLMARIRELAKSGAYSWGNHVFERSGQRDIDLPDAIGVLRLGEIEGPITPGNNPGEWKCKVAGPIDGSSRDGGVVVVVIQNNHMFLFTVAWADST
jgi:hypothetical protein